jgi:hypothetical protein
MKTLIKKSTGEYVAWDGNEFDVTEIPVLLTHDNTPITYFIESKGIELIEVEVIRKIGEYSNHDKELLEKYTKFLLDNSYVDCDVYCEPPSAIDRFMFPELNK